MKTAGLHLPVHFSTSPELERGRRTNNSKHFDIAAAPSGVKHDSYPFYNVAINKRWGVCGGRADGLKWKQIGDVTSPPTEGTWTCLASLDRIWVYLMQVPLNLTSCLTLNNFSSRNTSAREHLHENVSHQFTIRSSKV